MEIVAKYQLPSKFKMRVDFNHIFNRPLTFFISIEDVKLEFDYVAKYESIKEELIEQILHKIKMKFIRFDSNCDMIFTKYKDAFKDVETHVIKEEEKYNHLTKKVPTIYKALKKGSIELTIHQFDYDIIKQQSEEQIKFNYELPNLYKIRIDDYSNNYPVSILVPEIKIECPEKPELVKQSTKHRLLDKLRKKFNHFDLTLFTRPTEFFLKNNGTWTSL